MSSLKDKMKPAAKPNSEKASSVSESFRNPGNDEVPLKPLNVRIPEDLRTQLKLYAAAEDLKLQELVTAAIREYLEKRK